MSILFIVACLATFLLTYIATPLVKKFAIKIGAVDKPNERKVHEKIMPRMGGVAIYLSISIVYLLVVQFTDLVGSNLGYAILIGGFIIVLTGVFDDLIELSPNFKLLGQLLGSVVAILFGLQMEFITNPFTSESIYIGWIGIPLTIFWILAITNAMNLIDGLDGLASGVACIASFALFLISLSLGNYMAALILLMVCGSLVAFLFYNFYPAKIFMGDSGSLFLGYLLAIVSLSELKQVTFVTLIVPILILGVPISDTIYAMIRRKLNNQPISCPDKNHLHHRLLKLGLTHKQTVLTIYLISFIFSLLAILLSKVAVWVSFIILVFYIIVIQVSAEVIGMMQSRHRPLISMYKRIRAILK
jgi:UDP-GlcNAc:undecaprenyl-phosphate/decaprenyl-phosphate GlcNAc-1-phosphate transferase